MDRRPDSCNGEFPWPRQWGDEHLAPMIGLRTPAANSEGLVVAEQAYVTADSGRHIATVSARPSPGGHIVSINVRKACGALERGEAVILRDLLNEVLEATS